MDNGQTPNNIALALHREKFHIFSPEMILELILLARDQGLDITNGVVEKGTFNHL